MKARAALGAMAGLGIVAALAAWGLGLESMKGDAAPLDVAAADDLYGPWTALLERHVRDGGVDYDGLLADREELRRIAATFAGVGPRTRPELFADQASRFAFHINAYNALTLLGVVEHLPIASIQDVHGRIEPAPGFGFFWALRFRLDGRGINLYDLENKVLRPVYADARVHAAINCASRSCPTLQPRAFLPATLGAQLDAATAGFVGDDRHVRCGDGVVHLSSIFQWFRGDFEAHAERLGRPADVLAFVEEFTEDPARREQVALARTAGWERVYDDYDWGLNRAP